jgi:hypothetical protein
VGEESCKRFDNLIVWGFLFKSPCKGGPPWSDFREISCFRCKVPQIHAVDQSTIKSGLGQGIYDARHCGLPWRDIVGT